MDFLKIEQSEKVSDSPSDSTLLYIPMDRIIKVLKNHASWGDAECLVKVFHQDFSGSDAAIVVVEGEQTRDLGTQLGLVDEKDPGRASNAPRMSTL